MNDFKAGWLSSIISCMIFNPLDVAKAKIVSGVKFIDLNSSL
jgi:hypothetical protein